MISKIKQNKRQSEIKKEARGPLSMHSKPRLLPQTLPRHKIEYFYSDLDTLAGMNLSAKGGRVR